MKKEKYILLAISFTFLLFNLINNAIAQDINKALQYYNAQKYLQAALEFENALPVMEKESGKDVYMQNTHCSQP